MADRASGARARPGTGLPSGNISEANTQCDDSPDCISHADQHGTKTWSVNQLKQEFSSPSSRYQSVPVAVRAEFAKRCLADADQREEFLSLQFPNLQLDAGQRYELAQHYIKHTPTRRTAYRRGDCSGLPKFDIREPTQQIALAKLCITHGACLALIFAETLTAVDSETKIQLAVAMIVGGQNLSSRGPALGLSSTELLKLAVQAVRRPQQWVLEFLPDMCFFNKEDAYKIALGAGPGILRLESLKRMGLADTKDILQLAQYFAKNKACELSKKLGSLSFLTDPQRLELMEQCLQSGSVHDANLVVDRQFNADITYRWLLACAQENPNGTADVLSEETIQDPLQRLEIAQICAAQDADSASEHLEDFAIHDLNSRYSLALSCARGGTAILREFDKLDFIPEQQYEILCTCARNNEIKLDKLNALPASFLKTLSHDQLLGLVRLVATKSSDIALGFTSHLKGCGLIALKDAISIAGQCVEAGSRPSQALSQLDLTPADQPALAMEFFGLWMLSGPTQESCAAEYKAFDDFHPDSACIDFIRPLAQRSGSPLDAVSCNVHAIGGEPELGLRMMSATEITFLGALIQDRNLNTYFIREKNKEEQGAGASASWIAKSDANFANIISRLGKSGMALSPEQCRNTLAKLRISGSEAEARQLWNKIGQHARNMASFRSLAETAGPQNGKAPDPSWAERQQHWLRSILMLIEAKRLSSDHVQSLLPLLARLAVLKDEKSRQTLTKLVFATSASELAQLLDTATSNVLAQFSMLPFLEHNPWLRTALESDAKGPKSLKNYKVARPLMETFIALRGLQMPLATINRLVALISPESKNDLSAIQSSMQKLLALLRLSPASALQLLDGDSSRTLDGQLMSTLSDALGLKAEFNTERYFNTFGSFRDPNTLTVYAGRVKSQQKTMEGLGKFVEAVFNDEFPAIRYRDIDIFQRMDSSLLQRWRNERIEAFDGKPMLFAPTVASPPPSHAQILESRILNYGHLDLTAFSHLGRYLGVAGPATEQAAQQPVSPFERTMISYLEKPNPDLLNELATLLDQAQPEAELCHDLKMLRTDTQSAQVSGPRGNWCLRFTDDFQQLMRLGSDVGSCQRVDFKPETSQGLIGTILDGRSRLCLMQDESGKIVGRLILRLMWDETQHKPCLLSEPIYPDTLSAELREKLVGFTLACAGELGLDLVCNGTDRDFAPNAEHTNYPGDLWSGKFAYRSWVDTGFGGIVDEYRLTSEKNLRRVYWHQNRQMSGVRV